MAFDYMGNQCSTRTLWCLLNDVGNESFVLAEAISDGAEALGVLRELQQQRSGAAGADEERVSTRTRRIAQESDMSPREALEVAELLTVRQVRWLAAIAAYMVSRPSDDLYATLGHLIAAHEKDAQQS